MKFSSQHSGCFAGALVSTALLAMTVGCASPGVPRAPSLHLPERVTNLSAQRVGTAVRLRFVTPQRSTDNELLSAPPHAILCRAAGDGPCLPTATLPGKVAVAGPVEWADTLPPELASGAPRRLAYRVELFNDRDRSAGPSEPAFAAAGEAPRPVEGLRAEGSRRGVTLQWTPDAAAGGEILVERESLAAPVRAPGQSGAKRGVPAQANVDKRKLRTGPRGREAPGQVAEQAAEQAAGSSANSPQEETVVWLHADADGVAAATAASGMIDGTSHADEPYRYTAVRSRSVTVDARRLEMRSEPSAPVTFTLRAVYPPPIPQGLQAAGFGVEGTGAVEVDLVWQPNAESQPIGYNVYRTTLASDGSAGPAARLNEKPVELPAYHDKSAAHGVGYRYTVTAVDAKGNESAASSATDVTAVP